MTTTKKATTRTKSKTIVRSLDHLPLIARALKRLDIARTIDAIVPPHENNVVTHGQCVEALVTTILGGSHTLYRVHELLGNYDLETAFGWKFEAARFHDERLAQTLDALYRAGLASVNSAVLLRAVREYSLDLSVIHCDTTSASVHGDYLTSVLPNDPEDPEAIPHFTKGRSKDRKRGLKQVVYGTAVTGDGGVPVYGRLASGNRADALECRFLMKHLAELLPDPAATVVVGDSKFLAGETLLLAEQFGFSFVTLMSRTPSLWKTAFKKFEKLKGLGQLVELKRERSDRQPHDMETWQCAPFFDLVYRFKDKEKKKGAVAVRALVVESSSLAKQKKVSLSKKRRREYRDLEKAVKKQSKRVYECAADALAAAKRTEARKPRFHNVTARVVMEQRRVKRPHSGRPRKGQRRPTKRVWRVVAVYEQDDKKFERALAEESCFVLISSPPKEEGAPAMTEKQVFDTYQNQSCVETNMHWLKGIGNFAPIFLKTPRRVAALGQVYVIALMVHALIQRDARQRLEQEKATIPGNVGFTSRPTTTVLFRLFEKVRTHRGRDESVLVENLTAEQVYALHLLGVDLLRRPGVSTSTPRQPVPGDRGYMHDCDPRKKPRCRMVNAAIRSWCN
jgi:transposase